MKQIVTIGGGGGHAQTLKALKDFSDIQITAICPSTDSGGSTGIFTHDYGTIGYIGDLTKCIAALCPDPKLAQALMYRFAGGVLAGHSLKNILLLALEKSLGTGNGLAKLWNICNLGIHRVLPVTTRKTRLCATLKTGRSIVSETNIDTLASNPLWHPDVHTIEDIYLSPKVKASATAVKAIEKADYVILCPGDFYSSVIPVLLPDGVVRAIQNTTGRVILILNIMNKQGETDHFKGEDFIERIEKILARKVDEVWCNEKAIPFRTAVTYALEDKIEFKASTLRKDQRIVLAPFAEVHKDGGVFHSLKELQKQFKRLLKL